MKLKFAWWQLFGCVLGIVATTVPADTAVLYHEPSDNGGYGYVDHREDFHREARVFYRNGLLLREHPGWGEVFGHLDYLDRIVVIQCAGRHKHRPWVKVYVPQLGVVGYVAANNLEQTFADQCPGLIKPWDEIAGGPDYWRNVGDRDGDDSDWYRTGRHHHHRRRDCDDPCEEQEPKCDNGAVPQPAPSPSPSTPPDRDDGGANIFRSQRRVPIHNRFDLPVDDDGCPRVTAIVSEDNLSNLAEVNDLSCDIQTACYRQELKTYHRVPASPLL